ncbi:electron transport complex subunit RsxD [Neptuniibacter caesariensis]|uniref:Ion-translocating oxidoreductase complex subunit D n=1 Tax=Neptuniibacter caesariensis TaxID=207954 RepID=A0A7U8C978_NEPCE|nr:electron transport complex subunit RsxD [Neptuniibacter caesariensis]EAR62435.1 RnfD-related protein [Oceanospirillum sp. MED92] [Neptuniibacter caesariensis]
MALIRTSSPHLHKASSTSDVMRLVVLATLPGLAAMTFFFGWGTLINVIWAVLLAVGFEAIIVKVRKRPLGFYLKDYSAVVTALLLGLALPPFAPWWVTLVGVFVAIVIAKHLYGGLGQNPFNPAMVAYALLLVSFPVQMTSWTLPFVMIDQGSSWNVLGFFDTLSVIFGQVAPGLVDSYSGATPLDVMRHRGGLTTEEVWDSLPVLSEGIGAWHAVSAAYFMGGVFLIYRKVFTIHTPAAILITLVVISSMFYAVDPYAFADPFFHLTAGATMLGAFFIATDPVTSATSNRGKIIFGIGIGLLIYIIRGWGGYPDAVAFAVLLMNLSAPFIDQYTQPRTYGHAKAKRGMKGGA